MEPCDLSVQQRTGAGGVHAVVARVHLAVPFAVADRREEEFRVVEGLRQRRARRALAAGAADDPKSRVDAFRVKAAAESERVASKQAEELGL